MVEHIKPNVFTLKHHKIIKHLPIRAIIKFTNTVIKDVI